jgi:hypothetical protein
MLTNTQFNFMKRLFYTLGFMGMGLAAFAQTNQLNDGQIFKKKLATVETQDKPGPGPLVHNNPYRGAELWSSDFSDESEWMMVDSSTPFSLGWFIITDVNASPVGALNPIGLTGADNGFAMINADSASAGTASFQNASIRTVNPINLSDVPFIAITFEQVSRNFATTYFFEYSFDGETWQEIQINEDLTVNTNTANPEVFYRTVGDLIGNQPEVYIGFRYEASWGWFWAIDDVALVIPADNDLTLSQAYWNDWLVPLNAVENLANVDDHAMVAGYEFSRLMQGQERPLNFIANVVNNGNLTQTGVTLTATMEGPSGSESFSSAGDLSIEPGELATIFIDDVIPDAYADGAALGEYIFTFEITADAEDERPDDNVQSGKGFIITENTIANDNLAGTGTTAYTQTADAIWGTRMAFTEEVTITHIQFVLWTREDFPTIPGEEIFLNVREASVLNAVSANNPADPIFGETSLDYIIEEDALSTSFAEPIFINYALPTPIAANTTQVYQGEISVPAVALGADAVVRIMATGGNESFAGVIRDSEDSSLPQGWFGLGENAPMIRLISDQSVSVAGTAALNFDMGQNYPNPTTGNTRIDWELMVPATNVQFSLTDINGRTVVAKDLGDRPAGKQEAIELSLHNLAAGTYQYGITIGNERIVRKLMIVK